MGQLNFLFLCTCLKNLCALQKIYSLGGRKFAIAGLAPIGCLPIQMTAADILPSSDMPRTCAHQQNDDAMAYNMKLQGLVIWMQGSLSGTKIGYVDIYNQIMDMVLSPTKYGKIDFCVLSIPTTIFVFIFLLSSLIG